MSLGRHRRALLARVYRVWVLCSLLALWSSSTLAWLTPCCLHDDEGASAGAESPPDVEDRGGDSCCPHQNGAAASAASPPASDGDVPDEDGSCSCPVHCGPCCAGVSGAGTLAELIATPELLPELRVLDFVIAADTIEDGLRPGVLHVPRAALVS